MNIEEYLAATLDPRVWQRELDLGWEGSDGSTSSTDAICGVVIGLTTREFNTLPASRHDLAYRLGRRLKLGPEYRKAADKAYRDDCVRCTQEALSKPVAFVAKSRAHARYWVLRMFGGAAWREE